MWYMEEQEDSHLEPVPTESHTYAPILQFGNTKDHDSYNDAYRKCTKN